MELLASYNVMQCYLMKGEIRVVLMARDHKDDICLRSALWKWGGNRLQAGHKARLEEASIISCLGFGAAPLTMGATNEAAI